MPEGQLCGMLFEGAGGTRKWKMDGWKDDLE